MSYVHDLPDYNGHVGIRELCDICPVGQVARCRDAHLLPTYGQIHDAMAGLPEARNLTITEITERSVVVGGLEAEQPRYYLQHQLGFQVHDVRHPHHAHRHGRADIGWKDTPTDEQLD